MNIHIIDQQHSLTLSPTAVEKVVAAVIAYEGQRCDEVAVYFIDNNAMCRLHEEYFDDPSPTDCISFPIDSEAASYRVLGDIFVCPDTAITYAQEHRGDPHRETLLYIVHGLLHLMGYDDIDPKDEVQMRAAEARHMANLEALGLAHN